MIEKGDTLAVFYELLSGEKKCGGYVIWNNERVALTIWGNDNTSESKDGFHAKESFLPVYHIKNGIINNAMNSEFMAGNNFFLTMGFQLLKNYIKKWWYTEVFKGSQNINKPLIFN